MSRPSFSGYLRPDGTVGARNLVAIIPSCGCAQHAARRIAAAVPKAVLVDYNGGCGETSADLEVATRLLAGYGRHPNVVASIVVSLGCEGLDAHDLYARIAQGWAPTELLVIQEMGGTERTIARGIELAQGFASDAQRYRREPCPVSALTVGLECGGSDATSGLAANPSVGAFADRLIAIGGRAILPETSELLGAEHILMARAATAELAGEIERIVKACERELKATGEDMTGKQPSPGNIRGGISTVEEKALGDVLKGGSTPVVDVLTYGQPPRKPGLSFMDTPGNDLASVTGLAAAGCQVIIFTTGRGSPTGNAIVPVIKVTGNPGTYARMGDDIDVNAGEVIEGKATIEDMGARIYDAVLRVAEGEETAAERTGHQEFMMLRKGPLY
jgi:altronate dehydratase large subunit